MNDEKNKISVAGGTFTLCKAILGCGLLWFAEYYSKIGIIGGTALVIVVGICNAVSLYLLAKAGRDSASADLDECIEFAFGNTAKYILAFIMLIMLVIVQTLYLNFSSNFYKETLEALEYKDFEKACLVFTALCYIAVSIVFRRVDKLGFVSIAGLAALSLVPASSLFEFIKKENIDYKSIKLTEGAITTLKELSTVAFSFLSQFSIIPITNVLKGNAISSAKKVITFSTIVSIIIYVGSGICGYLAFPNTKEIYLSNALSGGKFVLVIKVFVASVNTFTYPLMIVSSRKTLHFFLNKVVRLESNFSVESLEVISLVGVTYILSALGATSQFLSKILSIPGALVMFILPTFLFIKINKGKNISKFILAFMVVNFIVGLTLFALSVLSALKIDF